MCMCIYILYIYTHIILIFNIFRSNLFIVLSFSFKVDNYLNDNYIIIVLQYIIDLNMYYYLFVLMF